MKKIVVMIVGMVLIFNAQAQFLQTFYKKHQTGIDGFSFIDGYTINKGGKYVVLGDYQIGHALDRRKFMLAIYDSTGKFIETKDFLHENDHYGNHNEIYKTKMFKNGEIYLNYSISWPGLSQSYFLDQDRKVVWKRKNDFYIIDLKQIDDSNYVGINLKDGRTYVCRLDYYGNIIWEHLQESLFHRSFSIYSWNYIDVNDSVISFSIASNEDSGKVYVATLKSDGNLIAVDSLDFGTVKVVDFNVSKYNSFVYSYSWDSLTLGARYDFNLLDVENNIIWTKRSNHIHTTYMSDFYIDKDNNYNILASHVWDKNLVDSTYYELFKVSSKGVLISIKDIFIPVPKIFVQKLFCLENGGYLLIANQDIGPYVSPEFSGVLIKIDSNGIFNSVSKSGIYYNYEKLQCFPNPLTATATIKLPIQPMQNAVFRLYSLTGRLVREEKITGSSYLFHRNNLQEGMYIYSITGQKQQFVGKLMIE